MLDLTIRSGKRVLISKDKVIAVFATSSGVGTTIVTDEACDGWVVQEDIGTVAAQQGVPCCNPNHPKPKALPAY